MLINVNIKIDVNQKRNGGASFACLASVISAGSSVCLGLFWSCNSSGKNPSKSDRRWWAIVDSQSLCLDLSSTACVSFSAGHAAPGLTRSHCRHGPTQVQGVLQRSSASPRRVCRSRMRRTWRLGYSLQLCTLLPPTGNVREANLFSWEEPDFLLSEIRRLQTQVIAFVLLHERGGLNHVHFLVPVTGGGGLPWMKYLNYSD